MRFPGKRGYNRTTCTDRVISVCYAPVRQWIGIAICMFATPASLLYRLRRTDEVAAWGRFVGTIRRPVHACCITGLISLASRNQTARTWCRMSLFFCKASLAPQELGQEQERKNSASASGSGLGMAVSRQETLKNGRTTAIGDGGGAIASSSGGLLTISDSALTGNSTTECSWWSDLLKYRCGDDQPQHVIRQCHGRHRFRWWRRVG